MRDPRGPIIFMAYSSAPLLALASGCAGNKKITADVQRLAFFLPNASSGTNPSKHRKTPFVMRMRSMPNRGIRRKPADKLPAILPSVDQKKIFPAIVPIPICGVRVLRTLIAYGHNVPSNSAGSRKSRVADTRGPDKIDSLELRIGKIKVAAK